MARWAPGREGERAEGCKGKRARRHEGERSTFVCSPAQFSTFMCLPARLSRSLVLLCPLLFTFSPFFLTLCSCGHIYVLFCLILLQHFALAPTFVCPPTLPPLHLLFLVPLYPFTLAPFSLTPFCRLTFHPSALYPCTMVLFCPCVFLPLYPFALALFCPFAHAILHLFHCALLSSFLKQRAFCPPPPPPLRAKEFKQVQLQPHHPRHKGMRAGQKSMREVGNPIFLPHHL